MNRAKPPVAGIKESMTRWHNGSYMLEKAAFDGSTTTQKYYEKPEGWAVYMVVSWQKTPRYSIKPAHLGKNTPKLSEQPLQLRQIHIDNP